jgi:hypothetical protein
VWGEAPQDEPVAVDEAAFSDISVQRSGCARAGGLMERLLLRSLRCEDRVEDPGPPPIVHGAPRIREVYSHGTRTIWFQDYSRYSAKKRSSTS